MNLLKYALVVVGVVMVMRSCHEWMDPAKVGSEMKGSWVTLGSFSGNGDQVTETLRSPYGKVRVRWEASNTEERVGLFRVRTKHPGGGEVRELADVTIGGLAQRSGERAIQGAQFFCLEVRATVPWEITVDVMH